MEHEGDCGELRREATLIAESWCDGAAEKKWKATTGKKKLVRGPVGAGYVIELEDGTREIHSEPLVRITPDVFSGPGVTLGTST